jgi:hypothetical protein
MFNYSIDVVSICDNIASNRRMRVINQLEPLQEEMGVS